MVPVVDPGTHKGSEGIGNKIEYIGVAVFKKPVLIAFGKCSIEHNDTYPPPLKRPVLVTA